MARVLASVATFAIEGVDSIEVTVEVDIRRGLPAFTIVGLPDAAVREARERVRSALLNSGLDFPQKRLTANLAPADLRKSGPSFDLALAVALLGASGQVACDDLDSYAVCGELSLGGTLRPVAGAIALAFGAREAGYRRLIVPVENVPEAALVDGVEVLGVSRLGLIAGLLRGTWRPDPPRPGKKRPPAGPHAPDMIDVRGQADAKRALEIAAAGGHHLLMVGQPGVGKTMLARRVPGILPPPRFEEALDVTRIHSVAGTGGGGLVTERPFRAPHHTISASGLVGGGPTPRPGEITLAHRGVLFLDELGEFSRGALEALRQPLESGVVQVSRGQRSLTFPAAAMLVATCNRCPCARDPRACDCTEIDRVRYARRLSAPLLDRIDLVCEVGPAPPPRPVTSPHAVEERSQAIAARVAEARERQARRLAASGGLCNGAMSGPEARRHAALDRSGSISLVSGHERRPLTGRGQDAVLRVARTVADLDGRDRVEAGDVEQALSFRVDPAWTVAA